MSAAQEQAALRYRVGPHGLSLAGDLTRGEWLAIGRRLVAMDSGLQWAIADWLVYGEGMGEYGEMYQDAADVLNRTVAGLSQYARTAREWPPETRIKGLSFRKHRILMRLPAGDRRALADQAVREGLSDAALGMAVSKRQDVIVRHIERRVIRPASAELANSAARWRVNPKRRSEWATCPCCGHSWRRRPPIERSNEDAHRGAAPEAPGLVSGAA